MGEIAIFGAGMAGLIAARMLHEREPIVYERSTQLPDNHAAVLRFRTPVVGDAMNIPFKKVEVFKAVHGGSNRIRDAVSYSLKATEKLQRRSILDLSDSTRYIAPSDFTRRLSKTANIDYGVDFSDWCSNLIKDDCPPIISTIPIPVMMHHFKWQDIPEFNTKPGFTLRAKLNPNLEPTLHATMYNVGDELWYRATLCGEDVIVEGSGSGNIDESALMNKALRSLGLDKTYLVEGSISIHKNPHQKMSDLDAAGELSVKRFIMWLSETHGIYSLGRMATWRPKLLLDDVVNDVRVIQRMIGGAQSNYNMAIKE